MKINLQGIRRALGARSRCHVFDVSLFHRISHFIMILAILAVCSLAYAEPDRGAPQKLIPVSKKENTAKKYEEKYKDGELLVKFKDHVEDAKKEHIHKKLGARKKKEFKGLRLHHVELPAGLSVQDAMKYYRADPGVEYAERNFIVNAYREPNDAYYPYLWGMMKINAPAVWENQTGTNGVVVAVNDTGIDYDHPDLAANVWTDTDGSHGPTFCTGPDSFCNGVMDDNGHGTHVAGTIGAVGNNLTGVVGVNWNVQVMACKFLDRFGSGNLADAISCLEYIKQKEVDSGLNIVATNNSWGAICDSSQPDCPPTSLYEAIQDQNDILFIAAAGNSGGNVERTGWDGTTAWKSFPAGFNLPNMITVAATHYMDVMAPFSNYGPQSVHVAAPGVDILSSIPVENSFFDLGLLGKSYGLLSGTSMAAPHVTGLAALIKSTDMQKDHMTIKNLIIHEGDPYFNSGFPTTITGKRINANSSINCNRPIFSVSLPDRPTIGEANIISVVDVNCGVPSQGPIFVQSSKSTSPIELKDDGVAPDREKGDAIFTGNWFPDSTGNETLTFTSQGRTISVPIYSISLSVSGNGTIYSYSNEKEINKCDINGNILIKGGSVVTIMPLPMSGDVFSGWSGCDQIGSNNECILTMTANKTVHATFEQNINNVKQRLISAGICIGEGSGTVFPPFVMLREGEQATIKITPGPGNYIEAVSASLLKKAVIPVPAGNGSFLYTTKTAEDISFCAYFNMGTVSSTAFMNYERALHNAVRLKDNKVLIFGGVDPYYKESNPPPEIYNPLDNTFTKTAGVMNRDRLWPASILLPNGKVLITGGSRVVNDYSDFPNNNTAEIYDPVTGLFSLTGNMNFPRYGHTATLLPNGKVLITGGWGVTGVLSSAEIYDPDAGKFTITGPMSVGRAMHVATPLPDGDVLITGGTDQTTTEIYNPGTGIFTTRGSLLIRRSYHSAILLPDGQVLIAGGSGPDGWAPASVEKYDPTSGTSVSMGDLFSTDRIYHSATLLPNGKVLFIGGATPNLMGPMAPRIEIYDPITGTSAVEPNIEMARFDHTATLLPGSKVLVAGGSFRYEEYQPTNSAFILHRSSGPQYPDLAMTAVAGPANAEAGSNITVNNAVMASTMGGDSGGFSNGLYLSENDIITSSDKRIGERSVAGLTAGTTSVADTVITLPSDLAPGLYYLGAIADYDKASTDIDRTNNMLVGNPIAIGNGSILSLTTSGAGRGSVGFSPSGTTCSGNCKKFVENGTQIILTALAEAGSCFIGWTGCDTVNGNVCTVAINSAKDVSVTFDTYNISVTAVTGAIGYISPGGEITVNSTIVAGPTSCSIPSFTESTYLHPDIGEDILLETRPVNGILSDQTTTNTFTMTVPPNVQPEQRYFVKTTISIVDMNGNDNTKTGYGQAYYVCAPPFRLYQSSVLYPATLSESYAAAIDNDTIQIQAQNFDATLSADRNISVTLAGGYNCTFSNVSGLTTISGPVRISAGKVVIKNIKLGP